MAILAGIESLVQHIHHLQTQPEDYRPECCPHCGKHGLWSHGSYTRQSDRRALERSTEAPILIPRFFCPACNLTCSCLPEAIPPRRWYLWDVQQSALFLLITSTSLNRVSTMLRPSRQTIKRWWHSLQARFAVDAAALRSRFAELGRFIDLDDFWLNCLKRMSLSRAMLYLHQAGVSIP